ncbi:MAG: DUF2812 domain-containing protein [Erysipelotrichaceae bacterium]|nr:DUF2812 domain-containing protein [Erysipelotrichaceae bacterium]
MKKTIYKLYWAWQFDKEEKWLNECSAKGLHLCDVGFLRYTFEVGNPGAYSHKLELLENWPTHPESVAYIQFLEDTGVEMVGSILRWVYFRKKTEDGPFDLFSDLDSRIKHLNRIIFLFLPIMFLEFSAGISNLFMQNSSNRFIGGLALFVGCLLAYGALVINNKKKKLLKERMIYE